MRTCPACGEDTDAGYAEACTECGFSPTGEEMPEPAPTVEDDTLGEATVGPTVEAPPPDEPAPPEQPPPPIVVEQPAEPPTAETKKRSNVGRGLIWLVVIAGFFGVQQLGLFDEPTGPDAGEVEQAIADSARQFGVSVTVDCPDDAEDTEVDATFTCTATNRRGASVQVVVTNREDTFEWDTGPLSTLRGRS